MRKIPVTLEKRRMRMSGQRMKRAGLLVLAVPAVLLPAPGFPSGAEARADETNRPGLVQFSNGEILEGAVSMTAGSELKIHTGKELRTLPLSAVQEMRFEPEKETMEQKWRFVEAGRTQKEKWGQPYPVREIGAAVVLADGTTLRGHVFTTVLYVEGNEQTTKVVLRAKDRGNEGQTLGDLVYPVRVSFNDKAQSVPGAVRIKVKDPQATEIVALTAGALLRLPGRVVPGRKETELVALTSTNLFIAVRTGDSIRVGWPAEGDAALRARLEKALAGAEEFFDARRLIAVHRIGDDIYTLLMLSRKGKTSLNAAQSQPWHLEVWRWKDNGESLMVAGRGAFFRDIIRKSEEPPGIVLSPEIWKMELKGEVELP